LIATQFDRLDGWGSYRKVTDQFNSAVYKLTPDLISRFEIEYVPTVITSENKHFVIEELAFNEETGL
jgi:conjugal transfer pilus assembly protein TraW